MSSSFVFTGIKEMIDILRKLPAQFDDVLLQNMRMEGEAVMTRSKQEFVPVDYGVLKSNGWVDKPIRLKDEITCRLAFGGAAAKYALAIHEHPSEHSPPSWKGKTTLNFRVNGTGVKYLEKPLLEAEQGFIERVTKGVIPA